MSTYLLNSGSFSRSNRAECVVIFEGLNSVISSSIPRPVRLAGKHTKLGKVRSAEERDLFLTLKPNEIASIFKAFLCFPSLW